MKNLQWLDKAPKWFQQFYLNDYSHLHNDVSWLKRIGIIILGAIIAGAIAIVISGG